MFNFRETRIFQLIVAIPFMLGLSSYSAWSVVQPHAMEFYRVSSVTASLPFYLFSVFFTVGSIFSGRLQKKYSLKIILMCGCCCSVAGLLITSLIPSQLFAVVCFSYGILLGTGSGISYNAVLSTIQIWFSDQIGKVTGILLCMVGISGFLLTAICNQLLTHFPFSKTFRILSLYYLVVYLPGLLFMYRPSIQSNTRTVKESDEDRDFTPREMLRTPHYYLIMFAFFFAVPAYTLINPIFVLIGQERGLSYQLAVTASMLVSVAQTIGRLIFPMLGDHTKKNFSLLLNFVLCFSAVITAVSANSVLFFLCFLMIGITYGGFMGSFPSISTKYFGLKNAGANYGFIMIGNSLAGIASPIIATQLPSVSAKFVAAGISCALGTSCILTLSRLDLPNKREN